jgi:DNA helicase-2/ATP-dependent DNA helicase PcrA
MQEERGYLAVVQKAIDVGLSRLSQPVRDYPHDEVRESLQRIRHEQRRRMLASQSHPYFARIDFDPAEAEVTERFYIGKGAISNPSGGDPLVIDWRAPVASLFYQPSKEIVAFSAPAGTIRGILRLKRRIDVSGGEIQGISDLFRFSGSLPAFHQERPPAVQDPDDGVSNANLDENAGEPSSTLDGPSEAGAAERKADEYLLSVLSEPNNRSLRDIVTTIQSEQDDLIRSSLEGVLLVQGVAGSGKTSVALHRVAYLLYEYEDNTERLNGSRIIVIGPSRIFTRYASGVLPELGVANIRQTTFDDLILDGKFIRKIRIHRDDVTLEAILDPQVDRETRAQLFRASRVKGSAAMGILLERWVLELREAIGRTLTADTPGWLTIQTPVLSRLRGTLPSAALTVPVALSSNEILHLYSNTRRIALNPARETFIELVVRLLWKKLQDRASNISTIGPEDFAIFSRTVTSEVRRIVNRKWPDYSPEATFRELLSDETRLQRNAEGLLSPPELRALAATAKGASLRLEDLGAICYLNLLLDANVRDSYDHIVVDEAQDLSPLQIRFLHRYARSGSMTLVGDLAQSVNLHRGIRSWDELDQAFSDSAMRVEVLEWSYRSSVEIIQFANQVLDWFPKPVQHRAHAIERHGPPVRYCECGDAGAQCNAIVETLNLCGASGYRTIAVITKTRRRAREFYLELREAGVTIAEIVSRTIDPEGVSDGVFVLPGYLAKGLEFDAAIVTDVDAETYTANELDVRLLYVAVTRALHSLTLCWIGSPSRAILDGQPIASEVRPGASRA